MFIINVGKAKLITMKRRSGQFYKKG